MRQKVKLPVRMGGQAVLKVQIRRSVWSGILPVMRSLIVLGLAGVVLYSGSAWILERPGAGALDHTIHTMAALTTAEGVQGLISGDVDNDGDLDVVTAGLDGIKIYINNGDKTFTSKLIDDKNGERAQIIDLDKDGARDILVTVKDESPSVFWYRNEGENEFTGTAIGTGEDGVAYAGDINGDGYPDIATGLKQGGEVVMQRWLNDGAGAFTSVTLATNTGVKSIHINDINGNGYQDIVTAGTAGLQRWDTNDGAAWSRVDIDDGNTKQSFVTAADVNVDGKMDLVVGETDGDHVVYYRNQDNSTWQRIELTGSADAQTVVVKDLDEDGDEDFIVADQDGNRIRWYSQTGVDEFTASDIATGLQSVYGVVVADLDGDNDFDFVAGDHHRGAVYWYERVPAKPVATAPTSIVQSSTGSGEVSLVYTVSDDDKDETRTRVLYSVDGTNWYKLWITKAMVSAGAASLKNSDGYQLGTTNGIDTDDNESVTVTLKWNTKSIENTGGPINGHKDKVRLRVIPRDGVGNGETVTSDEFEVDNKAPVVGGILLLSTTETEVGMSWPAATDGSEVTYRVYYGTNATLVINETSAVWTSNDDALLANSEAVGTTIKGLTAGTKYTFKLSAKDAFGNIAVSKTAQTTTGGALAVPSPIVNPSTSGGASVTPKPSILVTPSAVPLPSSIFFSPLPTKEPLGDTDPIADAGDDQTVNVGALVILDGTESIDPDGDVLSFQWRQISGPAVNLDGEDTSTPSFSVSDESQSYIWQLTVRDRTDRISTDTVVIGTRGLNVGGGGAFGGDNEKLLSGQIPFWVKFILIPIDWLVISLVILSTLVLLGMKVWRTYIAGLITAGSDKSKMDEVGHRGRVVHQVTGKPVLGARVQIFDMSGNIISRERADVKGEFALSMLAGEYIIKVMLRGFDFGSAVVPFAVDPGTVVYTGGALTIAEGAPKVAVVIPMKPTGARMRSSYAQLLQVWQFWQQRIHQLAWPMIILGSVLNTWLLFWSPSVQFLVIELLYVIVVGLRIFLELSSRPAYGLVRDAVTHVPIDLAVVRLYEHGTNKLILTRVTNAHGKFFGLSSSGAYTVTVTRQGYASFTKQRVEITSERDASVQLKVDMMPVASEGAMAMA